ncbi:hypothetical protein [Fulvimarina sp. MAC3]|uniref:hypothetical protein n=1 Tax=Fulvimarina sp. MAC3 TaxID=3148887 RepID=UPI0031FCF1AC
MQHSDGTRDTREKRGPDPDMPDTLAKRLGWFVLLWLGGIAAVSALAYGIRAVLIG